jgi:hypothetical protein
MEDMLRYLDEIAEPTIRDFEEHPTSRRHAFLACVAVYHAIDYLALPRKAHTLLGRFRGRSPDFHIVDQVAHAFKHVIGKRGAPDLRMGNVIPRPAAFCGVMVAGLSRLNDKRGGVTLYDNHSVDLLATLERAIVFLRSPEAAEIASAQ